MDMTVELAGATSAMAFQVPSICFSTSTLRRVNPTEKGMASRKATRGVATSIPTTPSSSTRSLVILASKAHDKDVNLRTHDSDHPAITSQEDLNYLFKLGAGSILGAAAIKYGSVLLPEITKPSIVQALAMISAPVVVAVLLLSKESLNK